MRHDQLTESVRQQIRSRFQQLGVSAADTLRETILICNGCYCGRRFEADGLQAIWFIEEDQVKFFHREGGLLEVQRDLRQQLARRAG